MSEFDSPNYAEYVYERKAEGTLLLARILMITAYVLFAGAFFVVCYTVGIIPVFAICPLLLFIIWLCTWRLVSYDYYYEFKAGTLELGAVRLKKSDRRKFPKLTVHIRDVEYADEYPGDSEKLADIKKVYDFSESKSSPNRIVLVFRSSEGRAAVIFEGTAKVANLIAAFCQGGKSLKGKKFHG